MSEINLKIQQMMTEQESLKNFYRFVSDNPHLTLHDASQIIIERPNATVCYSFDEWNEKGRRIIRGRKGIPFRDKGKNKLFVFDSVDTYGDGIFRRSTYPLKRLLEGLDELNNSTYQSIGTDFNKILLSVKTYLQNNDGYGDDEERNQLVTEGIAYTLYCKTAFPKSNEVTLRPFSYDLKSNASLFEDIQEKTVNLLQEIDDAYYLKQHRVQVVDDTEENYVTDEPITSEQYIVIEPIKEQREIPKHLEYYAKYLEQEKQHPEAIVVTRLGDFYEVFGKKAQQAADILDLTLTSKKLIDEERTPMCGFPYHAAEQYIDKLLEHKSVVVCEYNEEPKYILSYPEVRAQKDKQDVLDYGEEYLDDEDDSEDDDGYSWAEEMDDEEVHSFEELDELMRSEQSAEISAKPKNTKGIQQRKKKQKAQMSIFDFIEEEPQSEEEKLIEFELKRGSGVEHGKFRITDKYKENPTVDEFAKFLKNEYGVGGHMDSEVDSMHDGKGIRLVKRNKEHPEKEIAVVLKWNDVALRIADLIDADNYFTDSEKQEYGRILKRRVDRINAKTDEEKIQVITNQIVEIGTQRSYSGQYSFNLNDFEESWEFVRDHKVEIEQQLLEQKEVDSIEQQAFPYQDEIFVRFNLDYCPRWQKQVIRREIQGIAEDIINDGTENTESGSYITYFDELDNIQFITEHKVEIAEELRKHKEVAAVQVNKDNFDITYYLDYCKNLEEEARQDRDNGINNTDLNKVLDQSDLGGAKQRYRNNVEAIKLVDQLYRQNRELNEQEKSVLAKYVGWGGLAQVFDDKNDKWHTEYEELKRLLSLEDYENAKGSVLTSHYTSKDVINGMYKTLRQFGVKANNKILEPALGTGNFFGFMPRAIADNAKLYGVELDNITGRIASKLYPQAKVQIKGFEQTNFPNNFADIVITNVPFGNYSVFDSDYAKYNFLIHDYFIAKSIDKVKPNGIVAVITSKGTLDKANTKVRKYLADRAELLGAIRLPNNAFKQTANTEVTADILFFKKREEKIDATEENTEWLITDRTEEGYEINRYFVNHPEMVLGTLTKEIGLYGAEDVTVKPDGRELSVALNEAIQYLPKDFYVNPQADVEEDETVEVDYDLKPLCYKAVNGKLYMRVGNIMEEVKIPSTPKDAYSRITALINLRDCIRHILDIQLNGCSDEVLKQEQYLLNSRYDNFIRQYGFVNSSTNTKLFRDDGDSALVFSIEELSEDKKTAKKADIFTKRTIRPYTAITQTDDCFEALQISKNEKGYVDIAYVEELTKKDYDTVLKELDNAVFRNPLSVNPEDKYTGFETAEEYLSGNVVAKLREVRLRVEQGEKQYESNLQALEQVQPEPLKATDIAVRIGSSWVDTSYYKEFLCEILQLPTWVCNGVQVYYNPHDSSWRVDKSAYANHYGTMEATEVYGTKRANAYRLFEDCLNQKATTITDTVIDEFGKEKRVVNHAETIAAREKQNKIKELFKTWIFDSPLRREDLESTYNSLFNQTRLPSYDGSYLKFPEMNPAIELRDHQKNAVHRIITGGNTLLHHVVGSGKTFTVCAAAMKLRQYGLAKKPMIAVPNHLVEQWANEFRKLYPKANLLIASKDDLEKDKRKRFVSKVAMGDWDAVIIAQSSFAKINISRERQERKIHEEIEAVENTIENKWSDDGPPRGAVKTLERIKKSKEAQLKKLLDDKNKDDVLIFEELGVDYLFVDEADAYKNLFLFTKMNNVAGISNAASQRASDLKMKIEYINELHNGDKGVVFATGTPISNSMTEMYTMQSYLQQRTLQNLGITFFDSWAADFGEAVMSLELAPSGQGYRPKTRFAKFTNLPELLTMYRSFADVQTSDMVKLEVPDAEKVTVTLKPTDLTVELTEQIAERADRIYAGGLDPHIDNMLKVTSDGKKLALDVRCLDPLLKEDGENKLKACADNVYEMYKETDGIKGTQLVFCDLATPKKAFQDYVHGQDFDAYNELKYELVERGIPEEEIAFVHDANTDQQKQKLFNSVNSGKTRVLIGSTEKCGAGTNVQKLLVALHHLDAPYRPRDLIQRNGRGIRQGNTNKKVKIFTYVTERTFDSYSYQILENKQRFISQIDRGDLTVREAEDIDDATLSYAEIKAITSANPKIKRKMELDNELQQLRVLEAQHRKNQYGLQDRIRKDYPEQIQRQKLYIERLEKDIETVTQKWNKEQFEINVQGKIYTEKKDGGQALMDALYSNGVDTTVAEYGGLKISLDPLILTSAERSITLTGEGQYSINIGQSALGILTRLDNFMEGLRDKKTRAENKLEGLQKDLKTAQEQVNVPFEHAERILEIVKELSELNVELDLNRREEIVMDEGDKNEEDNGETLAIVEEKPTPYAVKKRSAPKTALYEQTVELAKNEENTLIFAYNNGYYEAFGNTAKELNELYNCKSIFEEIDGEKVQTVTLNFEELDVVARKILADGKKIKIVEEKEKQEVKYIEKVKENIVLPEYTADTEDTEMSAYPLSRRRSEELFKLGLEIRTFDGTKRGIAGNVDEIDFNKNYEIDGKVWQDFCESDEGKLYLKTRLEVANAASVVVNKEMSYFDAMYTDRFSDINSFERSGLKRYLSGYEADMQDNKYLQGLLDEFTDRIGAFPLEEYGWTRTNVTDALADNIQDETLRKKAKEYADTRRFNNYLTVGLMSLDWLNGRTENFTDDEIDEIVYDLKEHFEYSAWDNSGGNFDDWYEDFIEKTLKPALKARSNMEQEKDYSLRTKQGYKVESLYSDGKRQYAIFSRETDNPYNIAIGYDTKTGEWAQGYYDYSSYNYARSRLKEKYPEVYAVDRNGRIDYRDDVLVSIEEEFEKFKEDMLMKSAEDVFYKSFEIHVKTELFDTLQGMDMDEKYYRALYEEKGGILQSLYDDFISSDYSSVNSYEETEEFIEGYCEEYHKGLMLDFEHNEDKAVVPMYYEWSVEFKDKMKRGLYLESQNENIACKYAIEAGIADNYKDNRLAEGFEKDIIQKYGAERVRMLIANTIVTREGDGRFNAANVEWAKDTRLLSNEIDQRTLVMDVHSGLLDLVATRVRRYEKELKEAQDKTEEQTLDKKEDEVNGETESKWLKATVSKDAIIKTYETHTFIRMPETGEYKGYTYNIFNNRIKQTTQLTDLQSDTRETALELSIGKADYVLLRLGDDEVELTAEEFVEAVDKTENKDYVRDKSNYTSIKVPQEAAIATYEQSTLLRMPNDGEYKGYVYFIPNSLIREDSDSENNLVLSLPEGFEITVKNRETETEKKLSIEEFAKAVQGKTADVYKYATQKTEGDESKDSSWLQVEVDKKAKIAEFEKSTLIKMPKGKYDGYAFYLPNGMVQENGETLNLVIPQDFEIKLTDKRENKEEVLTAEQFTKFMQENGNNFEEYSKPSENNGTATYTDKFSAVEEKLRKNVPEEMQKRRNWCIVRTRYNEEKDKTEKFLIDCNTGKFAKSDDSSTWTDFNTACEYAKKNGGVALAYALDGKDNIACIDLDKCKNEKGEYTDLANNLMQKCGKTYMETSVSGKGLHIFGKTNGMDLRTFASDGDLEFYQNGQFIAMTGDGAGYSRLESFDANGVKEILESKCAKRTPVTGIGKGVEGLSKMTDRDVVEKAINSKHGETFKALYEGQDLQNNHSNSDMSLMNRLAFWCNGDKEQMLRIFATSGLYRPEKSIGYYECTVVKAIKDTTDRFQPSQSNKPNNSGNGSGK